MKREYGYLHLTREVADEMGIGTEWERSPDPLIHSWRWRQPKAQFYVAMWGETQQLLRDFRADFNRQLFR